MKELMITGFNPFGPYKYNPTQDIVEHFTGKTVAGYKINAILLPTIYYAFRLIEQEIERTRPVAIISTGLSSSVKGVRIETTARNIMNGKYADTNGVLATGEPIIENAPEFVAVNTNSHKYANILAKNNIPVEISADADGYTCNALIYETSHYIAKNKLPIKQFFLHSPWTDKYKDKIDLEPHKIMIEEGELFRAIELIVENL